MRFIKLVFWILVSIALILLALANRELVSLKLLPGELAGFLGLGNTVTLPLFVVILMGVLIGLLIGFIWEYLREYKHRRELNARTKEVKDLQREVKSLKTEQNGEQDEILALLDQT